MQQVLKPVEGLTESRADTQPGTDVPAAISARGVGRVFARTRALDGVSLDVTPGTIHALVGENGAGKSTFLGIVAGRLAPSAGKVEVMGREIPYGNARLIARSAGVRAIYQELTVLPALTARANVFLGHPVARWGVLAERRMTSQFVELAKTLGVQVAPGTLAGKLSIADQQMLEIMRALIARPKVLLLDEPTASLSIAERQGLYRILKDLRSQGLTLVLVSHNLDEVLDLADAITVFRDGRIVRSDERAKWTKRSIVRAMLGELDRESEGPATAEADQVKDAPTAHRRHRPGGLLLKVENLSVPGVLSDVSFGLYEGEVVGVAGLVGSGRTTLLRALAGLEPTASGRMELRGVERRIPASPRAARSLKIGLLPEDRKGQGLLLAQSAAENIVLGSSSRHGRLPLVSHRAMERASTGPAQEAGFPVARLAEPARNFSGGNQQKLLLARAAKAGLSILLADEPTRGIDIHAKAQIYESLRKTAVEHRAGVLVVSSDLEELETLCDRAFVLARSTFVAELQQEKGDLTVARILQHAFGVEDAA